MKRMINLCTQGDVQHPCTMRLVVPVYSEEGREHLKVCTSRLPQACRKAPHEINLQTRHAFCGPIPVEG